MKTVAKEAKIKKAIDPNTSDKGKNIKPARIPKRVRTKLVITDCINKVAAPVTM